MKIKSFTRIPGDRGKAIHLTVDGHAVEAYAGETVATVLLTSGHLIFHHYEESHSPPSLFCGMGVCYNCLVTIDGVPNLRACITQVTPGMVIETRGDHHD